MEIEDQDWIGFRCAPPGFTETIRSGPVSSKERRLLPTCDFPAAYYFALLSAGVQCVFSARRRAPSDSRMRRTARALLATFEILPTYLLNGSHRTTAQDYSICFGMALTTKKINMLICPPTVSECQNKLVNKTVIKSLKKQLAC